MDARVYISDRQIDVGIWHGETIYFSWPCACEEWLSAERFYGIQMHPLRIRGVAKRMQIFSFQQFLLTLYDHALYLHADEKAGINLNFEWERAILQME
ncbi:hypothetical protein CEXT_238401 [Caerostris extrusa]|uniref:Uncharacterized protein n=1 Tax=Caerostris extrusa TaxID=172846 RepID=A0AAV4T4V8_CAEEX|nr:hypothetical protein CEXT_238401 [Caerostris extrusa]